MFLDPVPVKYLRDAFDNWNRNGRYFPKPKDIADLVEVYKISAKGRHKACGQNGCMEGWIRVFQGRTERGHDIDPVIGAVVKCGCQVGRILEDNCNAECSDRHGKGYHTKDIIWLMKRYESKRDSLPNRPMTDLEVSALLSELDQWRGKTPAFRLPKDVSHA